MRYGAICKELHVLPRGGGVLDQPAIEIIKLEAILRAYSRYEDYQSRRQRARDNVNARHAPTGEKTVIH